MIYDFYISDKIIKLKSLSIILSHRITNIFDKMSQGQEKLKQIVKEQHEQQTRQEIGFIPIEDEKGQFDFAKDQNNPLNQRAKEPSGAGQGASKRGPSGQKKQHRIGASFTIQFDGSIKSDIGFKKLFNEYDQIKFGVEKN